MAYPCGNPSPTYYSPPLAPPQGQSYIYTPPASGSPPPHWQQNGLYGYGGSQIDQGYEVPHEDFPTSTPLRVPEHSQTFHPELGSQYQFQYSQCTGKRKALIIGINYIGSANQLNGCINDARNISDFFESTIWIRVR